MPAYLIVDISVGDWDRFREYVRLAPPIAARGGAWLGSGAPGETVEGDWRPARVSIASCPARPAHQ